jgi:hypothetical protein
MSARTDIEKRIEKEKAKINDLKSQIEKNESFILGLQEALKMLPKEKEAQNGQAKTNKDNTTTSFRVGSDVEKAYNLLRGTGKSMHISEILIGIGKEDTKINRLSLSSSLSRHVRKNDLFKRPLPNSFALIETPDIENPSLDLPPNFGAEEVKDVEPDDIPL